MQAMMLTKTKKIRNDRFWKMTSLIINCLQWFENYVTHQGQAALWWNFLIFHGSYHFDAHQSKFNWTMKNYRQKSKGFCWRFSHSQYVRWTSHYQFMSHVTQCARKESELNLFPELLQHRWLSHHLVIFLSLYLIKIVQLHLCKTNKKKYHKNRKLVNPFMFLSSQHSRSGPSRNYLQINVDECVSHKFQNVT